MREFFKMIMNELNGVFIDAGVRGDGGGGDAASVEGEDVSMGEDGDIMVRLNEEGNEAEPEGPGKGNPEEGDLADLPEEFRRTVTNKSPAELMKMLYEKDKFIGKQAQTIGDLKISQKSVRGVSDVEKEISSLDKQMEGLDEFDDVDKLNDLVKQKEALSKEHQKLYMNELADQKYSGKHNREFSLKQRTKLKQDYGYEFRDEDWGKVLDYAKSLSDDGKLTEADLDYALGKAVGFEKHNKAKSVKLEREVRADIGNAAEKEFKRDIKGGGGKPDMVSIDDMGVEEFKEFYDSQPASKQRKIFAIMKKRRDR